MHQIITVPRRNRYPGGMHRMHVHPPSPPPVHPLPPCASPPRPCASPPPQPERLVMRKDEAVGNKKKIQVCLHNYKLRQQSFDS
jgi:hypothetical protein